MISASCSAILATVSSTGAPVLPLLNPLPAKLKSSIRIFRSPCVAEGGALASAGRGVVRSRATAAATAMMGRLMITLQGEDDDRHSCIDRYFARNVTLRWKAWQEV